MKLGLFVDPGYQESVLCVPARCHRIVRSRPLQVSGEVVSCREIQLRKSYFFAHQVDTVDGLKLEVSARDRHGAKVEILLAPLSATACCNDHENRQTQNPQYRFHCQLLHVCVSPNRLRRFILFFIVASTARICQAKKCPIWGLKSLRILGIMVYNLR